MNDVRPAGRELQDQVLAAARQGQKRVARTVKNVTATAQQIRPQLPNLSDVHITVVRLPSPAQLREKAPELIGKLPKAGQIRSMAPELISRLPNADQLRERTPELIARLPLPAQIRQKAPELIGKLPNAGQLREQAATRLPKLPSTSQLKVGAEELATQFRSVQRQVVGQVREAATPLAKQAGAVLAQVSAPAERLTRGVANGAAAGRTVVSKVEDTIEAEHASKHVPVELAEPSADATAHDAKATAKTAAPKAARSGKSAGPAKTAKSTKPTTASKAAKPATPSKPATSQARRASTTRKPTSK